MASKLDIPLHEASLTIVKRCGAALCDIIDTKFGCVASIDGVDLENESRTSYQRSPTTITPEKRFEFMMRSGVKVSVWKADLTSFRAEAVVNAANEDLHHYGGLALALSKAGGPQIQKESNDYVKKHGKLSTADAVVLDPGSLPCKKIIHAVGPDLSINPRQHEVQKAKHLLEKVIRSILNRVEEHHLRSVAIPAISSGLFHYPLPECADTIVSTIKTYYDNLPHQYHRPIEIFLANHDEPTVQEMKRACNQIFSPQQQQSYSNAAAKNTRSAGKTPPSVKIGNVVLTLKKGHIEEENTCVIVNTASDTRDLNQGVISAAILKKAGYEIQKEIYRAVKKGNIFCTKAYGLNCKEVYHAICVGRSKNPAESAAAQQILQSSVYQCLTEVVNSQYDSISFPAIGTGNLGFHKKESAWFMSSAVAEFAERNQRKLDVYFVIYPSDNDTYQAFEAEIKRLQEKVSNFILATASGPKDFHTTRASTPQISLLCPSDESKHEAEKWLKNRLSMRSDTVEIINNFISYFSDRDHEQLALLAENGWSIEEFFSQGHACLTIKGKSEGNSVIAALQVEAMLCKIHKEFISEEENQLKMLTGVKVSGEKNKTANQTSREFTERIRSFRPHGLWVVKVDKVENDALKEMFDQKKKQLHFPTPETMFQRIPAQFCAMISRIGFHAECAPPEDPQYGEGIYFARNIRKALELWRWKGEEYLYFVEAEVLTGRSTKGQRGLILPPPVGNDPNVIYDSVTGGPDVSVIFSGYQALPKYIIICKKD